MRNLDGLFETKHRNDRSCQSEHYQSHDDAFRYRSLRLS